MAQDVLKQFVDDTINAAGFGEVAEEVKRSFRDRIEVAFAKRLGLEAVNLLGEDDLPQFEKFVEGNPTASPNDIYNFFATHVPEFETKVLDVMKRFQVEFLQAAATVT